MAFKAAVSKTGNILLGICTPCLRHNASKIKIQTMELDEQLLQFFRKSSLIFAYDPNKICKSGDIVLVEELPEKMSTSITHKVLEVVYPLGDITDPVTGKKVAGTKYRDELEEVELAFGKAQPTFNYKKAPKRGWQEGKKDFTHRESYIKYHEFEEGDENRDQPFSTMYS